MSLPSVLSSQGGGEVTGGDRAVGDVEEVLPGNARSWYHIGVDEGLLRSRDQELVSQLSLGLMSLLPSSSRANPYHLQGLSCPRISRC
jgi:hypothetical protein